MSKTETKDIFAVCQQNVNKCFEEVEKNVTQYLQAASSLHQEFTTAFKNAIETAIQFHHEAAIKSGLNVNIPSPYLKAINDAADEIVKTSSVQNKAMLAAIEATKQNVKTFNDNAKSLTDMNANILQSWFSAWTPNKN